MIKYLWIRGCSSQELGIINKDKRIIYLKFVTKKKIYPTLMKVDHAEAKSLINFKDNKPI